MLLVFVCVLLVLLGWFVVFIGKSDVATDEAFDAIDKTSISTNTNLMQQWKSNSIDE